MSSIAMQPLLDSVSAVLAKANLFKAYEEELASREQAAAKNVKR